MLSKIDLSGVWKLELDADKKGLPQTFRDEMELPGTTSHARRGPRNEERLIGSLTDEYKFEGYAWFTRDIDISAEQTDSVSFLHLERTRATTVWVNGEEIGARNSLNAPHVYELTGRLTQGRNTLTIRVDNTDYPTKGGHMTSPDTQTNWNGITGRVELQFFGSARLEGVRTYPNVSDRSVRVAAKIAGGEASRLRVSAESFNGESAHTAETAEFELSGGGIEAVYRLGDNARLWSEWTPELYRLKLELLDANGQTADIFETVFGLREFTAAGDKFEINGHRTFLRGKHDGLIFPLTGYAPASVEEWVRILGISRAYGMNHYRFHTACPPEAAFEAADLLGIYMEPELPFWGTITEPGDENHNQAEQDYLIEEGYEILKAFGNHPSFVMFSLGNELWGSRTKIDSILKGYKEFDGRPLYTQGSNNHQWVPELLEHDDFFCGVRFTRERLFRGSYAMCDAPQGHVQVSPPGTLTDYDARIEPPRTQESESAKGGKATIQIQYGTGMKTVEAEGDGGEWISDVPVLSHEIGQYATFPNFDEIDKYTGPLKAENFKIFRERLEEKGLGHLSRAYFENSGKLAAECYKEELEAALRSRKLAGFQLLDLQDFSGQGTALVGMLDAFMDSKGLISPEDWRSFCADAVLLAKFPTYNLVAGDAFRAEIELSWFRPQAPGAVEVGWELNAGEEKLGSGTLAANLSQAGDVLPVGTLELTLPQADKMRKVELSLRLDGTDVYKNYELWIYPAGTQADFGGVNVFAALNDEAKAVLAQGGKVLLMPNPSGLQNAIEGTYASDFWCYPMFRSISESMDRKVPVGTHGLLIRSGHPALREFPSDTHSTYSWWNVVMNSRSVILDGTPSEWEPIVQTIDNFERNHKLGLLFECQTGGGKLIVCPVDAAAAGESPDGRQFLHSVLNYVRSEEFNPSFEIGLDELEKMIR
ncbi:beta galactosidase jelly roll domain-containing protein [Saccharibacillus sp. CPCC 101409]|uniref:beta galactosidase jelly roll domain-containing protein n=1 Tax=Saccharibacillus sp. CPCC 101409 TaxID=3058041 RepID=UPI002670FE75|nr:beta galactosidase jelly roll domain-containing protein [Saccharibacillus sp. CPCC 101409]MDO3413270.1 beta galactosidase jelly roll domain-containing protein [Saccharibacillus sp. CPCC 101409]